MVSLLILVNSEKKKRGGCLFQDGICERKKKLTEFICAVQIYALLTNIRQNHRGQENDFTG